ncbi:PTS lactose/cellobiose transporter subunit IIA [Pantoea sp. LMR881]|uniref:PTS lactose/cellobiose transporter subunit IIA n=1 Tax=Pantoea sp. LMR881 TaxID=3014336 RepID=UPI002F359DF6
MTLLDQANQHLHDAHEVQTRLIGLDEGCGKLPVTLVMVHAQDHLMTAMLARDLISEMVALYSFPRHAA